MKVEVSIAMATYNGENYVVKQIESIMAQSFEEFELIIVDDNSSDKTYNIIKENFVDKRIKLYKNQKNLGVVKNFEKAISLCNGDYIALADQDDIWDKDKINILINSIQDNLLIGSDVRLIDSMGKNISESLVDYQMKRIPKMENQFEKIIYENYILGCSMLFNRKLINDILPIPEGINSHDWWIAIIAAKKGSCFFLSETLLSKRQHNENITGSFNDNYFRRFFSLITKEGTQARKKRYGESFNRFRILNSNLKELNNEQEEYLNDMEKSFFREKNKQFSVFRIKTFYKYRDSIYDGFNPFVKFLHVLAKIF